MAGISIPARAAGIAAIIMTAPAARRDISRKLGLALTSGDTEKSVQYYLDEFHDKGLIYIKSWVYGVKKYFPVYAWQPELFCYSDAPKPKHRLSRNNQRINQRSQMLLDRFEKIVELLRNGICTTDAIMAELSLSYGQTIKTLACLQNQGRIVKGPHVGDRSARRLWFINESIYASDLQAHSAFNRPAAPDVAQGCNNPESRISIRELVPVGNA